MHSQELNTESKDRAELIYTKSKDPKNLKVGTTIDKFAYGSKIWMKE